MADVERAVRGDTVELASLTPRNCAALTGDMALPAAVVCRSRTNGSVTEAVYGRDEERHCEPVCCSKLGDGKVA